MLIFYAVFTSTIIPSTSKSVTDSYSNLVIEEPSSIERKLSLSIPRGEYKRRFDNLLSQVSRTAKIKGFRPGRVPRAMVAKLYGEQINSDVLNEVIGQAVNDVVSEKKLRVVGRPEISIDSFKDDEDLQISAKVEIFPEPEIKDFKDLKFDVELEEMDVAEEVQRIIGEMLEARADYSEVEGRSEVEVGDAVNIDYRVIVGSPDESDPEKGLHKEQWIQLKSGRLPEEVDQAIIGMSIGAEKTIVGKASEEEDAPGELHYWFHINKIGTKSVPELTDDIAKEAAGADSAEHLRENLQKEVQKQLEKKNDQARRQGLFEEIIARNEFDVPEAMVDQEIRGMLMDMGALDPNKEGSYEVDVSQFREVFSEKAIFSVRRAVILSQLVKQEGIEVEEDDRAEWVSDYSKETQQPEEQVRQLFLENEQYKQQIDDMLLKDKMIKQLLSESQIKEILVAKKGD